jgi:hypothetical protein
MHPAPTPSSMARPSVAHRRWRAHRVVLALADRLADPGLWASGACRLRLAGRLVRPLAVVSDAEPPVDGVLEAAHARLVVQAAGDGRAPSAFRAAGAEAVWRVHPAGVEVCDATGTRALAAPCRLSAAVLARPLPWPLTPAEPAAR